MLFTSFSNFQLDEDVMILLERFTESKEEENSCGMDFMNLLHAVKAGFMLLLKVALCF